MFIWSQKNSFSLSLRFFQVILSRSRWNVSRHVQEEKRLSQPQTSGRKRSSNRDRINRFSDWNQTDTWLTRVRVVESISPTCLLVKILWLSTSISPTILHSNLPVQVTLVICRLFICNFAYMWLKLWHFRGTYPPIYQCYWSHYIRIHYMRAKFLGPYLSHITRAACTLN